MSKLVDNLIRAKFQGFLIAVGIMVLLFLFSDFDIVYLIGYGTLVVVGLLSAIAAAIIGGKENYTQKQVENTFIWIFLSIMIPILVIALVWFLVFC